MTVLSPRPFAVGKFWVTPLSRLSRSGRHTASVSIRRGHGRGTYDRIYTFKAEFSTCESALPHAMAQGRRWVCDPLIFA
jgi:hypothetical protein